MSDSLEKLLSDLRGGGSVDSTGKFMVDLQEARKKLRKFQLAEPSFYLLKLVQAAVAAGALSIKIELSRISARVIISTEEPTEISDPHKVVQSLSIPDPRSAALRHLAVALNASWAMQPERIAWSSWDGHRGFHLHFKSDDLKMAEFDELPGWANPYRRCWTRFELQRSATLLNFAKNAAAEHRKVIHRCAFANLPITLDGDRLSNGWGPPTRAPWHYSITPPFYLAERYELDEGGCFALECPQVGHLTPEEGSYFQTHSVVGAPDADYPTFCTQFVGARQPFGTPQTCRQAMAVAIGLTGLARVFFLIDGVTLESVEVDLGVPGLVVLADGKGLRTDLSELAVVQNQDFDERIEQLRASAAALKALLLDNLYRLPCHFVERSDDSRNLLSCLGCAFGGPIVGLLVAGVASAASSVSERAKVKRFGVLRRRVEKRLR